MARNEVQDIIQAIIGGGLQGFSESNKAVIDVQKEMWKEKLKSQMMQEGNLNTIKQLQNAGSGNFDYSVSPSGVTYKPVDPLARRKDILAIQESERKAQENTPEGQLLKTQQDVQKKQYESDIKSQAKAQEELGKIDQSIYNIQQLRKSAEDLPAGYAGIFSIGKESVTRGGADTNTRIYLKNMPAQAVKLYRDLTGDTRLSDQDAASRALPLLWHPSESGKVRTSQFDYLDKMLQAKKNILSRGMLKPNPLAPDETIIPLSDIQKEADSLSGGKSLFKGGNNKIDQYGFTVGQTRYSPKYKRDLTYSGNNIWK